VRSARAGLDHAILGDINSEGERADAKRIAELLRHGAHALGAAEERALAAGADFASEARAAALRHHVACCPALAVLTLPVARCTSHCSRLSPHPSVHSCADPYRECQNDCQL